MVLTHRNKWQVCLPSLPLLPLHHLFPLFLPSFPPSVYGPTQCARLDETILVISACNDTLLTPITTIKTLLPLGPFQVLINQMAAKRPFAPPPPLPLSHTLNTLVFTHTFSPALTDHMALRKKHIWWNKTSRHWQTNASTLQMKGKSPSLSPLPFAVSLVPVMWV